VATTRFGRLTKKSNAGQPRKIAADDRRSNGGFVFVVSALQVEQRRPHTTRHFLFFASIRQHTWRRRAGGMQAAKRRGYQFAIFSLGCPRDGADSSAQDG
jgi:hypothetical protein